ncbi:MAG: c-type cytochrome [Planctomycetaceae bacterium]|nr:c-type cytochrome [Planctomycetales bacterium]MCB9924621.1 c-type cytochrome [Planctomycetaceae bacterium]
MVHAKRRVHRLFIMLFTLVASVEVSSADEFPMPFDTQELTEKFLSPEEAVSRISVPEEFQVSLFASEPDVNQPIALATDERGRLWVAECYTYAESKTNYETKLKDRIVILEDGDGDGRFDKRTVFWDQASKLTSIEIGFGGVWALCAPDLLFIPDRDRDDVPDAEPVVVLNGWNDDVIRHNIVNGLRWGPDGWLYGRHGITTTSLVGAPETAPEHRTQVDCGIWRFHPTTKKFEVVCSGTTNPWGMDWDDHGQMFFINTVIGHLWHVIPGAYYQRMFGEHFDSHVYQLLPQTADHYHWDTKEAWHDIKKLGVTPTTDDAGGGHAHCGMMIYLGDNWPAKYRNELFACNLHGLRVNCDRLERAGATYVGKHEPDFLRTTDPWFRGIELVTGADGGVYIADWSDIGECHDNDGIHRSSGRIYKVTYGRPKLTGATDLASLGDNDLVKFQLHSNDWYVRNSRRVLQERAVAGRDLDAAHRMLRDIFDRNDDVTRKLRAMWTLYVTGGVTEPWLLKQLGHENEHVRTWAVKLLVDSGTVTTTVRKAFEARVTTESSGLVLTFLASALRQLPNGDRWDLAIALADKEAFSGDPTYPLMVWYGIEPAVAEYPTQAIQLAAASKLPLVREHIARRITSEIERQPSAVDQLVALLGVGREESFERDILAGMEVSLKGWRKAEAPKNWTAIAATLAKSPDERNRSISRDLSVVFGDGRAMDELYQIAKGNESGLSARRAAIHTLVEARDESIVPLLQNLLSDRDLGTDAIRGLAAFDDPKTPQLIIERYNSFRREPTRREAITTLTARQPSIEALLAAVSTGKIGRDQVSPFQLRQMQLLGNAAINEKIDRLWPELKAISSEKLTRIGHYREQLTPEVLAMADLSEGRAIFNQNCGKCHRLFGTGGQIGPDLTGSQRNNLNYLLENTVDPSATVSKNFHLSIALMTDGRVVSGIVTEENDRTITMQTATERIVLLRDDIEEFRISNLSMMPERQLDVMTSDQVRDLIGYLMSPSQVPLPGGTSTESND